MSGFAVLDPSRRVRFWEPQEHQDGGLGITFLSLGVATHSFSHWDVWVQPSTTTGYDRISYAWLGPLFKGPRKHLKLTFTVRVCVQLTHMPADVSLSQLTNAIVMSNHGSVCGSSCAHWDDSVSGCFLLLWQGSQDKEKRFNRLTIRDGSPRSWPWHLTDFFKHSWGCYPVSQMPLSLIQPPDNSAIETKFQSLPLPAWATCLSSEQFLTLCILQWCF